MRGEGDGYDTKPGESGVTWDLCAAQCSGTFKVYKYNVVLVQRSNVKQNTGVCYLYCLSAQEPQSQPRMPFCKMLYKQNKEHMS